MNAKKTCLRAWRRSMEKSSLGSMGMHRSLMMRPQPRSGGRIRAGSRRTLNGNHALKWNKRIGIMPNLIISSYSTTKRESIILLSCLLRKSIIQESQIGIWFKTKYNVHHFGNTLRMLVSLQHLAKMQKWVPLSNKATNSKKVSLNSKTLSSSSQASVSQRKCLFKQKN